jgi:hypothetical protein
MVSPRIWILNEGKGKEMNAIAKEECKHIGFYNKHAMQHISYKNTGYFNTSKMKIVLVLHLIFAVGKGLKNKNNKIKKSLNKSV